MPLIQQITQADRLFIGEVSLVYEQYDPSDKRAMLVVCDPSMPWLQRHRPHFLKPGAVVDLNNGASVILQSGATQKRVKIAIVNPSLLPVSMVKQTWARKEKTSGASPNPE